MAGRVLQVHDSRALGDAKVDVTVGDSGSRGFAKEEIDLVVRDGSKMLFAECKWRNEPTGAEVIDKLIYRSELFHAQERSCMVFSKSSFTSGTHERAARLGVRLMTLDQMADSQNDTAGVQGA